MNIKQFSNTINQWASKAIPFIFVIDYEMKNGWVERLENADEQGVYFEVNDLKNHSFSKIEKQISIQAQTVSKRLYYNRFKKVQQRFQKGEAELINLTFASPIQINLNLTEIFHAAKAPYKLLFKDQFVVFSPESFIKIKGNTLFTYPMKGTIDAGLEQAEQLLLNNPKEQAEHKLVVSLMHENLKKVATNVSTKHYRYIQKIETSHGPILQSSSEISGRLPVNWKENLGDILISLLPAGSISGMPKTKALEIIKEAENGKRGYYTGIFGVFDGENLDSGVMIRFIEQKDGQYYYRSGGGITTQSDPDIEYKELIQKIYVPTI